MKIKKYVIITGASSGIGNDLARIYAQKGNPLLLIARRENILSDLAESLQVKYGVKVYYLAIDLTQENSIQLIHDFCQLNHLQFDYFFNNAGIGIFQKFSDHDPKQINQMIQLNVKMLTQLSYFCLQYWNKHRIHGKLVNISSVAAYVPLENYVVYSACKAYVKSFSLSLRNELKSKNIQVNCVCPGGTRTDFFETSGQQMTKLGEKFMMKSIDCAEMIYQGVKDNNALIIPGLSNQFTIFLSKFLPEIFFNKLSTSVFNFFMKNS